jgi:DNA invertase Pin-like site-specific DNA recombinase
MKNKTLSALRVALYIRVSGEEQKLHGLSLEAQQEALINYAKKHGYTVVGIYVDAAKTARKRLSKRTGLQDLLVDV